MKHADFIGFVCNKQAVHAPPHASGARYSNDRPCNVLCTASRKYWWFRCVHLYLCRYATLVTSLQCQSLFYGSSQCFHGIPTISDILHSPYVCVCCCYSASPLGFDICPEQCSGWKGNAIALGSAASAAHSTDATKVDGNCCIHT